MIISNVNIGSGPGANDGESIYSAFYKVNQNFANVQSNVNSLTNSVSSVAGRTGNVTLTINDIVGLNTTYSTQANLTTANVAMRGYVDSKIAANVAALIDSAPGILDTLNELAAAINDDASFSTTIINTINLANTIQSQQIASANVGVIGYINLGNTIQSAQISAANLGMKGYVDSVASQSIYGNSNVASYLPTYSGNLGAKYATITGDDTTGLNSLVVGIPGIETFSNVVAQFHSNINNPLHVAVHNKNTGNRSTSGFLATADLGDENIYLSIMGIVGSNWDPQPGGHFLKPLDSTMLAVGGNLVIGATSFSGLPVSPKDIVFVVGTGSSPETILEALRINPTDDLLSANLELGANVGIVFSDGSRQTSAYSNVQTATFTNLSNYAYNANVTAANLGMKGYVDSVASQSIFGNGNVKSYLTQFDGNIIPSANVTYDLGSVTNRWRDLYLSGNTIFLGDATITTSGGAVLTPVTRQLFTQSFLPGSTNSAATFTLDRLPTAGSTRTVVVIGVQSGPSPAPSYTLTEGVDFTISGLSLIITTSYTATNISCTESYSDTGDLITATEVATDTITPGSGDLTVSGNVTVDGDLYVSPTSIYMGNLRISAADGNLKVNTGIKFSDDSVQSSAYSNVQTATFTNLSTYAYNANVTAANVGMKGYVDSLTYSNVQAESFITTFSGNVPQASLAYTVNISPVIVNLEYQLALLPAKEGAWGIKAADGTANVTYNPVSNRLTSANIQATGSIQTSGINGRIGYSAGGFVQQITANSNGVSLNTVSGNIQLMGINLGVNGLHTVSFTNNKLEETDLILVSHHSGGVSNFAVGAYYAAPSTAIIWIRNITGADTSTVTPMLKFALIKAPGS